MNATMKSAAARNSLATIESFLAGVTKTAEAHTETGSQGGPTTHPVKGVEDHTRDAVEGARSAENTKDIKEQEGKPSVDSTPMAAAKKADEWVDPGVGDQGAGTSDQLQIGTRKGPTGTNVPATKPGKDDPGTSHPARTDNSELNGGKYAADLVNDPLEKLAGELETIGHALLATIANDKTAAAPRTAAAPVQTTKVAEIDPELARLAGWELAGLLTGNLDKQAADNLVHESLVATIKHAEDSAVRTAEYLTNYFQARKQADAGGPGPSDMTSGGGDPEPAPPGGDPSGMPPVGPGGDAGGEDPELEQLGEILKAMGITPAQLIQTLSGAGGAGGGPGGPPPGMPPGGPGDAGAGSPPPPAGAPPMGQVPPPPGGGMQVTAADAAAVKEAAMGYISEVISRARAKRAAAKR